MEANPHLPESVFVEDTVIVLDELAIMTPMGVASRQAESKIVAAALDEETVLINPDWVDPAPFKTFGRLSVPPDEPFGANIPKTGDVIYMHAGFKRTRERITRRGYRTSVTDVSEFLKAEAGLTCMSLIFESIGS